jgi:hypothetical protein
LGILPSGHSDMRSPAQMRVNRRKLQLKVNLFFIGHIVSLASNYSDGNCG